MKTILFNGRILTIHDVKPEQDAFLYRIGYDAWVETFLNKPKEIGYVGQLETSK